MNVEVAPTPKPDVIISLTHKEACSLARKLNDQAQFGDLSILGDLYDKLRVNDYVTYDEAGNF